MSHRQIILEQLAPLEPFEVTDLKDWLTALQADCEAFGETPEDTTRMNTIKQRIAKEEKRT